VQVAIAALITGLTITLYIHRLGVPVVPTLGFAKSTNDGIPLPQGYREWTLISVASLGPPTSDIRAKLGNDIATEDFRRGTLPYRDGAIVARLAWHQAKDPQTAVALATQARAQGMDESGIAELLSGTAVSGEPVNVQFMIKDSKKYESTGGWRWMQFTNGKPDAIVQTSCLSCHEPARATDFVFTRYSQ
jgi:hypothetical protein